MNQINVGDTIICRDADDAVNVMTALAAEGIQTDFKYDYVEKPKIALEVTKVE